jgi:PKHD-type hydroxylase
MLLELPGLLNEAQISKIFMIAKRAAFHDGRVTAGSAAAKVKQNQELAATQEGQDLINRILMSSLGHSTAFNNAALPAKMADFIIARYQPGMTYGDHIDEPVMGSGGPRFRTDISMTIFLNPPDSYEGGELVIRTTFGDKMVKLNAGDAVLYPSSSLHKVAEVTSGQRTVALTWIQSMIRDPARREVLYDLVAVRDELNSRESGSEMHQQVDRSYANLLRMWAEV